MWLNTVFALALQTSNKNKHGADKAMIYLFNAGFIIGIFLLIMTKCVAGFCHLLELNTRKSQDAKNLAILQVFRHYHDNRAI